MEPDEFDRLLTAYDKVRRAHPDLERVVVSEGALRLEATRHATPDEPIVIVGTERAGEIDRVVNAVEAELEEISVMAPTDRRMFGGWVRNLLSNSDLDVRETLRRALDAETKEEWNRPPHDVPP